VEIDPENAEITGIDYPQNNDLTVKLVVPLRAFCELPPQQWYFDLLRAICNRREQLARFSSLAFCQLKIVSQVPRQTLFK